MRRNLSIKSCFIEAFGILGNSSGEFNVPVTIVTYSKGDLIVNGRGNERVQKLDSGESYFDVGKQRAKLILILSQ